MKIIADFSFDVDGNKETMADTAEVLEKTLRTHNNVSLTLKAGMHGFLEVTAESTDDDAAEVLADLYCMSAEEVIDTFDVS